MRAKQEREMAQRDERPSGGRYNDRDRRDDRNQGHRGDRNDRGDRDRRDNNRDRDNRGGNRDKQQVYKAKTKDAPRPKREEKKEEVVVVDITEEEMGESLKANFEAYVAKMKADRAPEEEEEGKGAEEDEKFDFSLYKQLKVKNAKSGAAIFAWLLNKVFDDDPANVRAHLVNYITSLHSEKLLTSADLNNGLSRFADLMPELSIDIPQIH